MDRRSFLTGLAGAAGVAVAGAAGISMFASTAEATPLDQLRNLSGRRRDADSDARAIDLDDGFDGSADELDGGELATGYGTAPDGTPIEQVWHHRRRRVCRWYWRRGVRVRRCWWVRW